MNYEAEKGYLILGTENYLACATTLAKSLKYWHPDVKICLLTDIEYENSVFDYVKQLPYGNTGGWTTDWQVFHASPFHETVKLEADMVVSGPVDHWWTHFRKKPVWISTGCKNFYNVESKSRRYRKIFDKNLLPDVYNAITYWRMSREAKDFFDNIKLLFHSWEEIKVNIAGAHNEEPNTDLIYALCADDFVTPGFGPQIVHMKPDILGINSENWDKELVWEIVNGVIRINGHNQHGFVHYHTKYLAEKLGEHYD